MLDQPWKINGFVARPNACPHEDDKAAEIARNLPWRGKCCVATWTTDFDCGEETQFWYCILDKPFDIASLNSKRRYEITKGNKYFETRMLEKPSEYVDEAYDVYLEALEGYRNSNLASEAEAAASREKFHQTFAERDLRSEVVFFGVFEKSTGKLCGFCDVFQLGRYLNLSWFKTRVSKEKLNVNFALLSGIIDYFKNDLANGAYLCDGARNALHQTRFQDFLIKYFGFRRAYCRLHIAYRFPFNLLIKAIFPFRKLFYRFPRLRALLLHEAWSRGKADKGVC